MARQFLRFLAPPLVMLALAATARAETETSDAQLAFNNSCRTCHSIKRGRPPAGPQPATASSAERPAPSRAIAFSSAMRQSSIVWDEATLDQFIANPEQVVHGNGMKPFGGIDDPAQRGKIIAYLKSISAK